MFNANIENNSNSSQNIWDQMALSNQLTLQKILNGRNNLRTPELKAAVATMTDEQRDNALVFLECNTEELAGLPDGCGIQAVKMQEICGTTFQQLSPTRGVVQKGLFPNLLTGFCQIFCQNLKTSQSKPKLALNVLRSSK